jgi:hypothetical protein
MMDACPSSTIVCGVWVGGRTYRAMGVNFAWSFNEQLLLGHVYIKWRKEDIPDWSCV